MAPINGEPFLSYQLHYLKHFGFKKVILSVGYLAEKIENYYGASFKGIQLDYVFEKEPLGTGGGIQLSLEKCADKQVLVLNGDSFFDVNLTDFYYFYSDSKAQCALALRRVNDASRYGTVITDQHSRIVSFKEKNQTAQKGKINGGIYILDKELYRKHAPAQTHFSIEKDFFEKQADQLLIKGFESDGYFIDIGIPEDYNKAQHDFKEFKYR
jgi:D-glycero-alpha-D-manno-heptose 1-phosphate guanylyltransferase